MSAPITCGDGRVEIRIGDCRDLLRAMPDESVHCVVTSPPYFGLRDYGVDGQIGLEASPQVFLKVMAKVFREVRRVLRKDGTAWVNMGDSYAGSWGAQSREHAGKHAPNVSALHANQVKAAARKKTRTGAIPEGSNLKPKDMMGLPWRLAFALQDDGWWLRQDIIWSKPNPMPESTRDRCTKAHEYLFLLTKSRRYFFDQDAIKETGSRRPAGIGPNSKHIAAAAVDPKARTKANLHKIGPAETRNKRSVWTVPSEPFSGAHFATYPPRLIEPCVLAGCPKGGVVLDPFGGAGTTGLVAARHGRQAILLELNPEYAEIARRRIDDEWGIRDRAPDEDEAWGPLFSGVGG